MVRATRQSTRLSNANAAQSSTATPATQSPFFSAPSSVIEINEDGDNTPPTSDIDMAEEGLSLVKETSSKTRKQIEEDDSDADDEPLITTTKRRATSNRVYVEIPPQAKSAKAKGKQKAVPTKSLRHKRKHDEYEEDEEEDNDDGLEYNEAVDLEESDSDDDSSYKGSDAEVVESEFSEDDEEVEALQMQIAVEESIVTARGGGSQNGASSSRPRNDIAARILEAAERRAGGFIVDDSQAFELSSDDEPLSKSRKRKAGKKPTKRKSRRIQYLEDEMELTEAQQRRRLKVAEKQRARELGRKLTHQERTTLQLQFHHEELKDVWGDLEAKIEIVTPVRAEQPENLKVKLLPFQQESLYWMRKQEQGVWSGGMLADEMGMGKTIQIISLLVTDGSKPNLVVAPTVAIMQWRNEIAAHTDGMNVLVWHGSARESNIKELQKYDVVLTTYSVLESCFRKQESGFKRKGQIVKERSPVHQIKWNRIVLDEAHNIKERSTNTAKAAFELQAKYRWCLSGTPLQNRVGELYSLVRFLGGDPFSYYFCKFCDCKSLHWSFSNKKNCDNCRHSPMQHTCLWNNEILTPIQKHAMIGPGAIAFKKLKILLDRMMLRRTKLQRADDLGLPPRTVVVRRDYFSPEEKELYSSLFTDAKRQFNTYLDQGTVLNNYSNIFSLLTRMRQMACHPDLVIRSKTNASVFAPDTGEGTVCRLCNDFAEDAIQSKCRHIFDRECIRQYLDSAMVNNPACPVCHLPITIDLEAPALELEESVVNARQGILGRLNIDTWRSSSKIEALVEELSNLRMKDATTKSIVFSQFVNFLDLIAFRLQRAGFNVCRLEGTMSPQARDATIQYFMNNVHVTVFLVSLKAGGVALNLTEASRVYLMDSWWNPAVEYQAMDRIHRLGQRRPVQAIKLVVEDSIESRIIQLQEKKSAMVDATLSADDSAMGRLTPEDLGFLFRM